MLDHRTIPAAHRRPPARRPAGSRSACHLASASAETLAYLANDRTEVCPDSAISIGMEAPSSAAWVRPEWRS